MQSGKPQESSELLQILQKRDSQFDTLSRLSAVISQSEDLHKALNSTLDQILSVTGADIGSVHLLEPRSTQLRLFASRGVSEGFVYAEESIPVGDCLCGLAASTGEIMDAPDLSTDHRLTRAACRDERLGSMVSIPLKTRDRVLGLLTIYSKKPNAFSVADRDLLILIGRQIGVAIENAQLYTRTREMAVLEERGLIAQEIHDGIAQSLAYLNLETKRLEGMLRSQGGPQALSMLDHIRDVIRTTYEDVRELLVDFRTRFKEGEGLMEALNRHIQEFGQRTGIRVTLLNTNRTVTLSPSAQIQVFRIVQEALSNVRKHASAKEVTVRFSTVTAEDGDRIQITVQDDGHGFDPQTPSSQDHLHLGLQIMRERAATLQGRLELVTEPGRGTTLIVTIPVKSTKE
jgi:two-component system nitrate/nitrite sensor histidine kinase NarX